MGVCLGVEAECFGRRHCLLERPLVTQPQRRVERLLHAGDLRARSAPTGNGEVTKRAKLAMVDKRWKVLKCAEKAK